MSFIRNLKYFVAAALLVSLPAAGCSKDKDKEKAEGEAPSGEAAAKQEEGKPAAAGQYSYLPADSNFILGINLGEIRSSKVFKDMVEPVIAQQAGEDYEKIKTACGFDPMEKVQSIVVGGVAGKQDRVAIAIKGLTADQVKSCGEKMAEIQGEEVEITQEGKLTKVVTNGEDAWFGWVDDTTMVTAGPHKELVEALVGGKEGLSGNEAMMGLVGKVDTKAALWLGFDGSSGPSPMAGAPVQVKAAHASVSLAQGLLVNATISQSSPEEAQKSVADFTGQLDQMKQSPFGKYISKLELKANESDVVARLNMNDAELQEMINDPNLQMFKAMLGL